MGTLVEQLITKLGLRDQPQIMHKTNELQRLLDLRSSSGPLQINEYAKIVLCADIAASSLGVAFDREEAVKLSGARKTQYFKYKRMIEKLLDVKNVPGINEICIQLGLNEITKKAMELMELYKKTLVNGYDGIDVSHPQYAAMAVFYACKLTKGKAPKQKLLPFSNLRPTQWMLLEQHWAKFIANHYNNKLSSTKGPQLSGSAQNDNVNSQRVIIKPKQPAIENYEDWKSRMLRVAHETLNSDP